MQDIILIVFAGVGILITVWGVVFWFRCNGIESKLDKLLEDDTTKAGQSP